MKRLLQKLFGIDHILVEERSRIARQLIATANIMRCDSNHNFDDVDETLKYIAYQLYPEGEWSAKECLNHVEEVKAEREFNELKD